MSLDRARERADGVLAIAIIECATVNCTIANFGRAKNGAKVDRKVPLIAILCNAPKALSCATNQSFEPSMRYADERPRLQKLDVQSKIVLQSILAERSQNGQYFQRRSLNAALTAAVRPFDALATLLLRPTCGPCD